MEWTHITSKTLLTQIPPIIEKNNASLAAYMDLYYDGSRGVIIAPLETTGRIKAGNGEFVNVVVDNLSVKNQYTNLYDNITTADYDFYKTTSDVPADTRDASLDVMPAEDPAYKYIDVNKPYYKITNTNRIAFKSDNLSQVVHVMFDMDTVLGNDFIVQLNPRTKSEFKVPITEAISTWVELIMTDYDSSWGGYWELYRYGTLDGSALSGGGDSSYGTVSLGAATQIPFVNGAGNDFAYNEDLEWDGTRLKVSSNKGTNSIFIGDKSGNISSNRTSTIAYGFEAGKSLTTGNLGTYIGHQAGTSDTTSSSNTFVGGMAGFTNTIGGNNTYIGANSGYGATGVNNVFLGANSGKFETDSNVLFIDNQSRVNKEISKLTSLVYGKFSSSVESQVLRFNAQVELTQIDASVKDNVIYYDTNTNRLSYGLQSGGDSSTVTYQNGLTNNDNKIELGGELLSTTSIVFDNTQSNLTFNDDNGDLSFSTDNGTDVVNLLVSSGNVTPPEIILSVDNEINSHAKVDISYDNITLEYRHETAGIGGMIIDGSGIRASKNFKDTYTARSFVDKEYVDIVAGGGLEVSLGSAMEIAFMNESSTGFQYDSNFMWDGKRLRYQDDNNNILLGSLSGWENTGSNNIFIGQSAGYNIPGSDKLVIANNHDLTDLLSARSAMIYGEFNDDVAVQMLRINGELELTQIKPEFKDYILYWDPDTGRVSFQLSPTGTISFGESWEIPFMNPTKTDLWYSPGFKFDSSEGIFDVSANMNVIDVSTQTLRITAVEASTYDNILYYDASSGQLAYGESISDSVFFNGLSYTDASVVLGGVLTKDTIIDISTYSLTLSGGVTLISDVSINKLQFNDGSASDGYFMATDSSGNATWSEIVIPDTVKAWNGIINTDGSLGLGGQLVNNTSIDLDSHELEFIGEVSIDGSTNMKALTVAEYQYMGLPDIDGSWRFYVSVDASADMVFEKRVSGVWIEANRFVI